MSTRFSLNLSVWIGITVGIYVLLYLMSPLGLLGALPCTFVALPIYLSGGARTDRFFDTCLSAVAGVAWGIIFIYLDGVLVSKGLDPLIASACSVALVTIALCATHLIFTPQGLFSNIPMMFGAVACTFFVGPEKWFYIMITLCLGVALGFINHSGRKFLDEHGRWKIFQTNKPGRKVT